MAIIWWLLRVEGFRGKCFNITYYPLTILITADTISIIIAVFWISENEYFAIMCLQVYNLQPPVALAATFCLHLGFSGCIYTVNYYCLYWTSSLISFIIPKIHPTIFFVFFGNYHHNIEFQAVLLTRVILQGPAGHRGPEGDPGKDGKKVSWIFSFCFLFFHVLP